MTFLCILLLPLFHSMLAASQLEQPTHHQYTALPSKNGSKQYARLIIQPNGHCAFEVLNHDQYINRAYQQTSLPQTCTVAPKKPIDTIPVHSFQAPPLPLAYNSSDTSVQRSALSAAHEFSREVQDHYFNQAALTSLQKIEHAIAYWQQMLEQLNAYQEERITEYAQRYKPSACTKEAYKDVLKQITYMQETITIALAELATKNAALPHGVNYQEGFTLDELRNYGRYVANTVSIADLECLQKGLAQAQNNVLEEVRAIPNPTLYPCTPTELFNLAQQAKQHSNHNVQKAKQIVNTIARARQHIQKEEQALASIFSQCKRFLSSGDSPADMQQCIAQHQALVTTQQATLEQVLDKIIDNAQTATAAEALATMQQYSTRAQEELAALYTVTHDKALQNAIGQTQQANGAYTNKLYESSDTLRTFLATAAPTYYQKLYAPYVGNSVQHYLHEQILDTFESVAAIVPHEATNIATFDNHRQTIAILGQHASQLNEQQSWVAATTLHNLMANYTNALHSIGTCVAYGIKGAALGIMDVTVGPALFIAQGGKAALNTAYFCITEPAKACIQAKQKIVSLVATGQNAGHYMLSAFQTCARTLNKRSGKENAQALCEATKQTVKCLEQFYQGPFETFVQQTPPHKIIEFVARQATPYLLPTGTIVKKLGDAGKAALTVVKTTNAQHAGTTLKKLVNAAKAVLPAKKSALATKTTILAAEELVHVQQYEKLLEDSRHLKKLSTLTKRYGHETMLDTIELMNAQTKQYKHLAQFEHTKDMVKTLQKAHPCPHELAKLAHAYNVPITQASILKNAPHLQGKRLTHDINHLFTPVVQATKNGKVWMTGYHHDAKNIVRTCPLFNVRFREQIEDITKIIIGPRDKYSTLFPSSWTKKTVMEKIMESITNGKVIPQKDGSLRIIGKVNDNTMTIRSILNTTTGKIISAFPDVCSL